MSTAICRALPAFERYRIIATGPKYKVAAVPQQHHRKLVPRKISHRAAAKPSHGRWAAN
jgi:hypothetical protein